MYCTSSSGMPASSGVQTKCSPELCVSSWRIVIAACAASACGRYFPIGSSSESLPSFSARPASIETTPFVVLQTLLGTFSVS